MLVGVLHRELLQSILVVQIAVLLGTLDKSCQRAQTQKQIMHPAVLPGLRAATFQELLQSIILLEVASWIQPFDYRNVAPIVLLAAKQISIDHRM